MPPPTRKIKTQAFHEVIVELIDTATPTGMVYLADVIKATSIPKNHDNIIEAWKTRLRELEWNPNDLGVIEKLCAEREVAAKKIDTKKQGIDLDILQGETERLLALLKDRQHRLSSWNEMLQLRIENFYKLTSQALGK